MAVALSPSELRMLHGMRMNPRRSFHGRVRGERLTRQKGLSVEFADYRDYSEGDDLRHLDWNVLARLQTPIIRTYRDEQDLAVYLLVDRSPSMSFGTPTKLEAAARLALAFGFIALSGGDAAYPAGLPMTQSLRPLRSQAMYPRLQNWAESLVESNGEKSLSLCLREFLGGNHRPGIVLLFSDGFDPELPAQLRALGGRGHEVLFLQILAQEEVEPDLEGDVRLLDSEKGPTLELTATLSILDSYLKNLESHCQDLKVATERFGGKHMRVTTDVALGNLVSGPCRKGGWLVS